MLFSPGVRVINTFTCLLLRCTLTGAKYLCDLISYIARINEVNVYVCFKHCVSIYWVRIVQRDGYELVESGNETSELGYESSGYKMHGYDTTGNPFAGSAMEDD